MIVKNEAARLTPALESFTQLGELLDEVCIYDTGSSDDTVALARAHGATVVEGYWDDDFARARNAAAAMASAEWLLVVDADEQVVCDAARLEQTLAETPDTTDAFMVPAEVDTRQMEGRERWLSPRIYRPSRARYHRPVHTEIVREDGTSLNLGTIGAESLLLLNSGFDQERAAASMALKDRLTTALIERGGDGRPDKMALVDRGRARGGQGRHDEALKDLRVAFELPGRGTTYDLWAGDLLVGELLHHTLTEEAVDVVERIEEIQPGRAYTRWLRARVRMGQGKFEEAFGLMETINHALDGGLSPLRPAVLYRAGLDCAIEMQSEPRIIACLTALVGVSDQTANYGLMMARWWNGLSTSHLLRALGACADRPIADIARDLVALGGEGEELGRRLIAELQSETVASIGDGVVERVPAAKARQTL